MSALKWAAPIAIGSASQEIVEGYQSSASTDIVGKVKDGVTGINIMSVVLVTAIAALIGFVTGFYKK